MGNERQRKREKTFALHRISSTGRTNYVVYERFYLIMDTRSVDPEVAPC